VIPHAIGSITAWPNGREALQRHCRHAWRVIAASGTRDDRESKGRMKVKHLLRAATFAVVLAVAVVVGVAVAFGSALLGHETLVLVYGGDLSVIDDTLPMVTAVWTSCLAGIVAGLVVLVVGWRRFVRGPGSNAGHDERGADHRV
jgi:hypothetical protein